MSHIKPYMFTHFLELEEKQTAAATYMTYI